MHELADVTADMQSHANELKNIIASLPSEDTSKLRRLLCIIEVAIFVVERISADARRAA